MARHRLCAGAAAIAFGMGFGGHPALAQTTAAPTGAGVDPLHGRGTVEEIVITASPLRQSRFDILQGTSVLTGEALDRAISASIGETLDRLPGVSQSSFGQGSSRPIIRGLSGDRIRVLIGGIGTIDASTTSPDHAPAIDLATAKRVEVVRGPATLLYGNNAVGGVVNVLDGRIPVTLPEGGTDAFGRFGYGSNADERLAAAGVDQAIGAGFVFHGDIYYRETDNFRAPGFIESEALRLAEAAEAGDEGEGEEEERGEVENSDLRQLGGTGGVSVVRDWGFFGVSGTRLTSNYGIPGGHGHEEEGEEEAGEEEEELVRIDIEQTRIDVMGEVNADILLFESTRFRFGWADYDQVELEGEEIGTTFLNTGWEGRLDLVQRPVDGVLGGKLTGAMGVQVSNRDFEAEGEEAFVPPSETLQYGFFGLQRLDVGPLAFEAGLRVERQRIEAEETGFDRGFTGVSVSGGIAYGIGDMWLVGLNGYRTERAPNAEELLSDGPHLATDTFEIGDPTLDEEVARGGEFTIKLTGADYAGAFNLFYTNYRGFIFERFTGEEEDGLPVAQFTATDARFWGAEVELEKELVRWGSNVLFYDAALELVRAQDLDNDVPLPRIPPLQLRAGLQYERPDWAARFEWVRANAQDNLAPLELATDGYTVWNGWVEWHPFRDPDLSLMFEVRNLTDEEVRLHTSFLKDTVPQPGRDFRIQLRGSF